MKLINKIKHSDGRREIYFLGVKVFSYQQNNRKYEIAGMSIDDIKLWQTRYKEKEVLLKNKYKNNETIKIAFLVGMSSMFCAKPLMKQLIKNKKFKVSILVVPDFRFGKERAKAIMSDTLKELSNWKDYLIVSDVDEANDKINLSDIADICFLPVPYDFSHYKYTVLNIISQGVLPCMVNYGFFRSKFDRENLVASKIYSLYWKVFVETKYNLDEFLNYSLIKGDNAVLTGYCKMDDYKPSCEKNSKKTILIAPHHSVVGGFNDVLALSNFEAYAELFMKLPDLYPNIDFIFRPHPALFSVLARDNFWGVKKVDEYISKMKNKTNVIYSTGGDYFEEFAKSDAIIQDCGSYLVEYFYTKKPQCYLLKTPEDIDDKFVELGKKCLDCCYIAYNEQQILDFINEVVIDERDVKAKQREDFAAEVMLNYPSASSKVVEYFDKLFSED